MTIINPLTVIGNGLTANDGTGDTLRTGAAAINANSAAIVTAINNLAASQSAGAVSYLTKADMDADLAHPDGTIALVTNDGTAANNQAWRKSGASGSGSWTATIDRIAAVLGNGAGFQQSGAGSVVRTFQDKGREVVSIQDKGGIADGATDISAALARAVSDGVKRLHLPASALPYKLTADVEIGDMEIYGDGPGTVIDATSGTFASSYVLTSTGSLTALPALNADVAIGASSIVFASAPSLVKGDVFVIYNPTDSSWSGHRAYYRAGEFCEVADISGSTVTLRGKLYDSYAAATVQVWKLNSKTPRIRNLTLNAAASLGVIRYALCRNPVVENVRGTHAGDSVVSFDRCIYPEVRNSDIANTGGQGNEYGVVFGNCQHGKLIGGGYYSRRHAMTTGGSDVSCAVPNRDIRAVAATFKNNIATGVESANFHGNSEDCSFENCTSYSGFTLAGKDVAAIDCHAGHNLQGTCYVLGEMKGGYFDVHGGSMRTYINPFLTTHAIVDAGANSATAINAFTTLPTTVKVQGVHVIGRNLSAITTLVSLVQRGGAAAVNAVVEDITFDVDALGNVLLMQKVSGTAASSYIIVDHIAGAPSGAKLANLDASFLNFPLRLMRQSGVYRGTTAASASVIAATITLPLAYPRVPNGLVTLTGAGGATLSSLAGKTGVAGMYELSATQVRPLVLSGDGAAFTAGTNFDLRWSVALDEC